MNIEEYKAAIGLGKIQLSEDKQTFTIDLDWFASEVANWIHSNEFESINFEMLVDVETTVDYHLCVDGKFEIDSFEVESIESISLVSCDQTVELIYTQPNDLIIDKINYELKRLIN